MSKTTLTSDVRLNKFFLMGKEDGLAKRAAALQRKGTVDSRLPAPPPPKTAPTVQPTTVVSVHENILDKPFAHLGEFLLAVRDAADPIYKVDPRLHQRAISGASETVPSDGGFLIAPEIADSIAARIYSTGQLLSRFQYFPLSNASTNATLIPSFDEQSRADGSRFGGVKSSWVNESSTVTATKPKYRNIALTLKKMMALAFVTDELMADAATLGAALHLAFGNELAFKAEQATVFGDGSGKPLGMLNTGNPALLTVAKDNNQAAATISAQNLISMYQRQWGPGRRNAVWLISESVDSALIDLSVAVKNAAGTDNVGGFPLYIPATSDDDYPRILGRPALVCEYMQPIGTVGDIAFVDPTQFAFAYKSGPDFVTSLHCNFLSNESTFRAIWRVDGSPMWNAPVTPYNGGSTLSAYVTLAAR